MNRREVIAGAAASVAAAALPAVPVPDIIIGAVYRVGAREIAIELKWVLCETRDGTDTYRAELMVPT